MKILLTKITPPQTRRLVKRTRLLSLLERFTDFPLVVISASAGFGKTSLLASFLAYKKEIKTAWYSLDESDRDPAVFCRYLLHSIRQPYPGFGKVFEELLDQNLTNLNQELLLYRLADEFITELNELEQNSPDFRETVLVLDDYQFAESQALNRLLNYVLKNYSGRLHLVIATRTVPKGLDLATLVAKQRMFGIGAKDLAFTAGEINQLLREFYELDKPELAEELAAYSEGWIAAVILALSNDTYPVGGPRQETGLPENWLADQLFEYLAQEVFQNQPPELQEFLLKTCVLKLLSPVSCATLIKGDEKYPDELDIRESENQLKQLEARNLFVSRIVSGEQVFYQYHALFRQFLLAHLSRDKSLYRAMQLRAGEVQEEAGVYEEGLRHYLAAGETERAVGLLDRVARSFFEAGRTTLLDSLLQLVPKDRLEQHPNLLSVKARVLLESGYNQEALEYYARAERLYRQQNSEGYAALEAAEQSQVLARLGRKREALEHCGGILRVSEGLIQSEEGKRAVALAKHVSALVAIEERSHSAEAEQNLKDAAELYSALRDDLRVAIVESYFGLLYHQTGRLVKSNVYYERALAYFVKSGNRLRECYCRVNLAINLYHKGQYQQAEKMLNEALEILPSLNDQFLRIYVLAYLANIYRDTERFGRAEAIYGEGLELARSQNVRKMELFLLDDWATCYILQQKEEEAFNYIQTSLELADQYELPERKAFSYRNKAWLEYSRRSYKKALTSIQFALDILKDSVSQGEIARTRLAEAIFLLSAGEPRKALTSLSESLEQSEELGYEPFLSFEKAWAVELFEFAARRKVNETVTAFLRRHSFISDFPAVPYEPPPAQKEPLPEPIPLRAFQVANRATKGESQARAGTNPQARLRAFALETGRVWNEDKEIKQWRTSKAREALFFLLEHNPCSKDELWEALWPDESLDTSPNLLNTNITNLRKTIAPVEVRWKSGRYYLEGDIWYDVPVFTREVRECLAHPQLDSERLRKALSLYKRDFLDQFYSNWSIERQQELQRLYLNGLERLGRYHQENGDYQQAIPAWRQLLVKDAYNEDAHAALIKCYIETGNRPEALHQYEDCLKTLEELDLEPSAETSQLLRYLA